MARRPTLYGYGAHTRRGLAGFLGSGLSLRQVGAKDFAQQDYSGLGPGSHTSWTQCYGRCRGYRFGTEPGPGADAPVALVDVEPMTGRLNRSRDMGLRGRHRHAARP